MCLHLEDSWMRIAAELCQECCNLKHSLRDSFGCSTDNGVEEEGLHFHSYWDQDVYTAFVIEPGTDICQDTGIYGFGSIAYPGSNVEKEKFDDYTRIFSRLRIFLLYTRGNSMII